MDKALTDILICDSCSYKHGCEDLPSQKNRCDRYRNDKDRETKTEITIDSKDTDEFDYYHDLVFLD